MSLNTVLSRYNLPTKILLLLAASVIGLIIQIAGPVICCAGQSPLSHTLHSNFLAQLNTTAQAQTIRAGSASLVTASIPDHFPPTTPVLISPENTSVVNTNTPRFVWVGSEDDTEIQFYQIVLNNTVIFDAITPESHENDEYTVTYNSDTNQFILLPKNPIKDGVYTWKITATDTSGNTQDSVTWTFTIDTLVPVFVVEKIGTISTSISAHDVSTIPTNPILIPDNSPLLIATGEPLSMVELTITIPGECTGVSKDRSQLTSPEGCKETIRIQVDKNGEWRYNLGILPRGKVLYLDFLIIDKAGHISVLENVPIMIIQAAPGPDEIVDEITDTFPPVIQRLVQATPTGFSTTITISPQTMLPYLALLIALTIPLTTLVLIATKFGSKFSLQLLWKLLYTLGIIPGGEIQGVVIDDETNLGVPFALVMISTAQKKSPDEPIDPRQDVAFFKTETDIAITDEHGFYRGLSVPDGDYRISVIEPNYVFPSHHKRPTYYQSHDFYKGEHISVQDSKIPLLLIPASKISYEDYFSFFWHFRVFMAKLNRHPSWLLVILLLIVIGVTTLSPTIINGGVTTWYFTWLLFRIIRRKRKKLFSGTTYEVTAKNEQSKYSTKPLKDTLCIVRYIDKKSGVPLYEEMCKSNEKGCFSLVDHKRIAQLQENCRILFSSCNMRAYWRNKQNTICVQRLDDRRDVETVTTVLLSQKTIETSKLPVTCLLVNAE